MATVVTTDVTQCKHYMITFKIVNQTHCYACRHPNKLHKTDIHAALQLDLLSIGYRGNFADGWEMLSPPTMIDTTIIHNGNDGWVFDNVV